MRLLVDTHLLLWATARSRRLPAEARRLLEDPVNEVFHSAASLWEIAMKLGLGRTDFKVDLSAMRDAVSRMGFVELPVTGAHAVKVRELPAVHRDPFDRMLVAQSLCEPLILLTNDEQLTGYGTSVKLVR